MSIQPLSEKIFKKIQAQGAEADLLVQESEQLSLKALQGELDEMKVTHSLVIGLRVIKDQRVGIAYTESVDDVSLDFVVEQALTNAAYNSIQAEQMIHPNEDNLKETDAELCPKDPVSTDEKIASFLHAERELSTRAHVTSVPYNGFTETVLTKQIFSTQGLSAYKKKRKVSTFFYPLVKRGHDSAMALGAAHARSYQEISFASATQKAYQMAIDLIPGKPLKTGRYDVIFKAEVLEKLFNVFALIWSGKSAQEGINPWHFKLGEQVADPKLCIEDQPLSKQGFGYSTFDDEGIKSRNTRLIDHGNLCSFIHNSATANYFGISSTGHAKRSPKGVLNVNFNQLHILPGQMTEQELFATPYLYLVALEGLHSGTNALTGEFSVGASGFLMQGSTPIQAVRGITIAGNFFKLLNQIKGIGEKSEWTESFSAKLPPIRFYDLAISGD